jgi:hypothetical protein
MQQIEFQPLDKPKSPLVEVRGELVTFGRDLEKVVKTDAPKVLRAMGGVVRHQLQDTQRPKWSLWAQGLKLLDKFLGRAEQAFEDRSVASVTTEELTTPDLSEAEQALLREDAPDAEETDWREARSQLATDAIRSFRELREGSLPTHAAAELLGVNDSSIRQRLAKRKLFGFKVGGDEWRLPRFQFDDGALVPGIDQVFPRLPKDISPVLVDSWFNSANPDLIISGEERTPIEWLRAGNPPKVIADLAARLGMTP